MAKTPGLELSAEQEARVWATFGTPANYKRWLKVQLAQAVVQYELQQMDNQHAVSRRAMSEQLQATFLVDVPQ